MKKKDRQRVKKDLLAGAPLKHFDGRVSKEELKEIYQSMSVTQKREAEVARLRVAKILVEQYKKQQNELRHTEHPQLSDRPMQVISGDQGTVGK